MIQKIKNYLMWGVMNLDEIIIDKEAYYYFYIDDLYDIRDWTLEGESL